MFSVDMTTDSPAMKGNDTPQLRYQDGEIVAPGDRLGVARMLLPGSGTYRRGGYLFASVAGKLCFERNEHNQLLVCVKRSQIASFQVLSAGQIVMGRVVRVSLMQATVEIIALEKVGLLKNTHEGAIRKEDIRSGASEQVQIQDSFLPGDLIVCRVLSLGDNRKYMLSTAEASLGVIHAVSSKSGKPMVPISWKEMECPETGAVEPRKCAKPRVSR